MATEHSLTNGCFSCGQYCFLELEKFDFFVSFYFIAFSMFSACEVINCAVAQMLFRLICNRMFSCKIHVLFIYCKGGCYFLLLFCSYLPKLAKLEIIFRLATLGGLFILIRTQTLNIATNLKYTILNLVVIDLLVWTSTGYFSSDFMCSGGFNSMLTQKLSTAYLLTSAIQ